MPTMAMGIGSVHRLESPFTTGESFCNGTLPLSRLECGAIFPILQTILKITLFGIYVSGSVVKGELKFY